MLSVRCQGLLLSGLLVFSSAASAVVTVTDDAGRAVTLQRPAQRIVSLAPHATELLFEAGAGHLIVGVSDYSDYPEQAKKLPSVGNIFALDLEQLIALKPDLVVVWGTGNARLLASKLRSSHVSVFESEPHDFEVVATSLERLAILTGTEPIGKSAAGRFRSRLESLRKTYQLKASEKPMTVFYQVWHQPLMSLNDQHLVSKAIKLCGGTNIFGTRPELSPTVTTEAVLAANPAVIIASDDGDQHYLAKWLNYPSLTAGSRNRLYTINGNWLNRAGPRVLDGTEELCQRLAEARKKT
jgi:iron complex transport system substrate-binding protein